MGHTVLVYDWCPPILGAKMEVQHSQEQRDACRSFAQRHLPLSLPASNDNELVDITDAFGADLVLVGSDAVFHLARQSRGHKLPETITFPNPFWLGWLDRCRRRPLSFAIAASAMGTVFPLLPLRTQNEAGQMLRAMTGITVRDTWSRGMVEWLTFNRVRPGILPDPAFVLNEVLSPAEVVEPPEAAPQSYVLLGFNNHCFPKQSWLETITALIRKRGFRVYSLPTHGSAHSFGDRVLPDSLSPLDWYSWIKYSAGYIGPTFHTPVCCLANNVPFVSLDLSRPVLRCRSKIWNLCQQWGETARYVDCGPRLNGLPSPAAVATKLFSTTARSSRINPAEVSYAFTTAVEDILRMAPEGLR